MNDENLEKLKSYERVFLDVFGNRLAEYESHWIKASSNKPEFRWYFDAHLSQLKSLKVHMPRIAREVAKFSDEIDKCRHDEVLNELDDTLGRRERNFSKMLVAMVRDHWRLARLERARGRVVDLENAVGVRIILRNGLSTSQLVGKSGYLDLPENFPNNNYGSAIANNLASAMWGSSKSNRRAIPLLFVRFYARYFLDIVRRNRSWVIVTLGVFGFGTEFLIQSFEMRLLGGAAYLILAAFIGTMIFERLSKRRWLEYHKTAMRNATTQLYMSFFNLELERTSLEVIHKLSDPKARLELQRSNRAPVTQGEPVNGDGAPSAPSP